MTSPLLTAAEVAEILQTSERHVQRLAALEVRPLPSLDIGTGGLGFELTKRSGRAGGRFVLVMERP